MVLPVALKYPSIQLFLCLALVLCLIEWGVLVVGRKFKLGPTVSVRSSHKVFTPTLGGLVWVFSSILGVCLFGNLEWYNTWIFMIGIGVLAVISLIDDLHPLPPIPRLIAQIVVMALSFSQLCYKEAFDVFLLCLFCGVGLINAINFLDGICGMLALYGIVVTGSLIYAFNMTSVTGLVLPEGIMWLVPVLVFVLIAQVVFACFNLKDVIFAGDVGAITLGYIQVFAAITLMIATSDGSYMIFFAVCVFDTGLTTMQRLFLGESILEPHRMNIYQILTSDKKLPHIVVSLIYALLQLLINALYFLLPAQLHWTFFLATCALLTIAYFALRFSLRRPKA